MFEFTESDLKSNRNGFVSGGQREWLDNYGSGIRSTQRGSARVAIIFPFLGLCILLAMALSNADARATFFSRRVNLAVLICLVPFVLLIFALGIYFADRRADRLSNPGLLKAEGVVELDESHSSVGAVCYVIVGKTNFTFGEDISGIFQDGASYRIYYCETSMLKLILSYEKIT